MAEQSVPTAAFVCIGDEILNGKTADQNIHQLAVFLSDLGIDLVEVRVVSDDLGAIRKAVSELRCVCTYVFTSGGIGPTHDDITADGVGAAFGIEVVQNADAFEVLRAHYPPEDLTPARLRMARMPVGAMLIGNPVSAAPGFQIENVFVMAGVPKIFAAMLVELAPRLVGGVVPRVERIETPRFEGDYGDTLGEIAARYPSVQIGSYPVFRAAKGVMSTIQLRSRDENALGNALKDVTEMLEGL